ncbi:unknown [Amedibacillus dolichus CAG:375]|uniref:Uncharacterized protein n=1 Tax=Amedibacillus dolichus CAG:375 TaxID=1263076 RepID=R7G7E6_9FIRM|nr:unknown [Amedibacillus dolichus CAG:375]
MALLHFVVKNMLPTVDQAVVMAAMAEMLFSWLMKEEQHC